MVTSVQLLQVLPICCHPCKMPAHYVCRDKTEVHKGVFWESTGQLMWHSRKRTPRSLGRFLMESTGEEGPSPLHPVLRLFPHLSSNQGHARDDGLWGQYLLPNEMNEKCPQDALPFTAGWGQHGSGHVVLPWRCER